MTARRLGATMRLPDSPYSPRHCGARFLRQQEAGASSFPDEGLADSRFGRENAETRVMGAAAAHPISPELVLVSPELREHALRLLPAIDPDALFEVDPRPAPPPELHERPRLVLVEPERRTPLPVALAAYATEAVVLGALRAAGLTAAIMVVAFLLAR